MQLAEFLEPLHRIGLLSGSAGRRRGRGRGHLLLLLFPLLLFLLGPSPFLAMPHTASYG